MAQARRGCGCALAGMAAGLVVVAAVAWFLFGGQFREWMKRPAPPEASGKELRVHVLDVGQADSILIQAPSGKVVLVDAGEPGDGKRILEAMKKHGADHVDLFVATHAHADHIGAADEVIKATNVGEVWYSGVPNTTKNYEDFLKAVDQKGIGLVRVQPGQTFDLGDGAILTVLGPTEPLFTKEDLRSGGNEPNANSVVARLDYGEFSMLLTGDAEAQTEERLMKLGANVEADVLKVGHHGSKYATSENFIKRGGFKAALVSAGLDNRYGHPSQEALNRLRAAQVRLYRTDFQGEITLTTRGSDDFKVTTAKEAGSSQDLWAGREAMRDDSSRRGFIDFGDLPPAPTPKPEKPRSRNTNAR